MTMHMTAAANKRERGFSLIEMMVGMLIGLLCTLVIAAVLSAAEGQRRGTTEGGDAIISGQLALYAVQRELATSGYGFVSEPTAVGCPLVARFNGVQPAALPPVLAPAIITAGADGASDSVRVLSSSKFIQANAPAGQPQVGFALPIRVVDPQYTPGALLYPVKSLISVVPGDLMVAVVGPNQNCELFQATGTQGLPNTIAVLRATQAPWNSAGFPAQATQQQSEANPFGSYLLNLGQLNDRVYSVDAQQRLTVSQLNTTTLARSTSVLQGGVVLLKAFYGKDADGDGAVDTYDTVMPATPAQWLQVMSIRIAVAARSAQYEREEVVKALPQWDVGDDTAVAGAVACGVSKCIDLKVDADPDWRHYRYKVFDTVVPLRNQRWKSRVPELGNMVPG